MLYVRSVPLQEAFYELPSFGPCQTCYFQEVGLGVDARARRGVVKESQRDYDVAEVLALLQDRRRCKSKVETPGVLARL